MRPYKLEQILFSLNLSLFQKFYPNHDWNVHVMFRLSNVFFNFFF
jgi:hypothetical protein